MGATRWVLGGLMALIAASVGTASGKDRGPDPIAVERGRVALTEKGYLKPVWKAETYAKVGDLWESPHPDARADPEGYAAAFNRRYGLQPAPFPNDGLPLGLRRGVTKEGRRKGSSSTA